MAIAEQKLNSATFQIGTYQAMGYTRCCKIVFFMSDKPPKSDDNVLKSKILNLIKGQSVKDAKNALKDCLKQIDTNSKVV